MVQMDDCTYRMRWFIKEQITYSGVFIVKF